MPPVEAVCPICQTAFTFKSYSPRKFCSAKCAGVGHRVKRDERTCPTCQQLFISDPEKPRQRFCCRSCATTARHNKERETGKIVRVEILCLECGKAFTCAPSALVHSKNGSTKKYCSTKCGFKGRTKPRLEMSEADRHIIGKVCSRCKTWKPFVQFSLFGKLTDGHLSYCKKCKNKDSIRWYINNRVHAGRQRRMYVQKNAQAVKQYHQRYYQVNKAKMLAYSKAWFAAHPEIKKQVSARWTAKNLNKHRIYQHNRRVRKMGNGGTYTVQEWESLCAMHDNRCLSCGEKKTLTVDHVCPISRGGRNDIQNLQPLCRSCNCSKGTKIIDYRHRPAQTSLF